MIKTIYDIFISYRRDGGGATAGRINDKLTADGYSVSYDVNTLREGRFDEQLLKRIEECQDFILVVDKNCFARTINPATNPKDDWLWLELSYALRLKKNVIPVLLAGASFPKDLPKDIDNVRYCNSLKCVHEYFDYIYTQLKEFLHAHPRITPTNMMPCLKLKADMDCIFHLDGEEHSRLKAGIIQKIPLAKGEYELMFVSEDNDTDRFELEFEMPEVDKFMKVNLREIMNIRVQKEEEAKLLADEKRKTEEAEERKCEAERKSAEEEKRLREEEWNRREEEVRKREVERKADKRTPKNQSPNIIEDLYQKGVSYLATFHNSKKAIESLERAAIAGHVEAQNLLGVALYKEKDYPQALQWLQKAAVQGHPKAQYNLGKLYYKGNLGKVNYNDALKWFVTAANNGNDEAWNMLGVMYDEGKGVTQNYNTAYEYYLNAANAGNVAAQYNIGCLIVHNKITHYKLDRADAIKWFELAAKQGDLDAKHELSKIRLSELYGTE